MPDLYFYRDAEEEEPKEEAVEEVPVVEPQWGQETLATDAGTLVPGLGDMQPPGSAAAAMEALAKQTIPSWAQQVENVRFTLLFCLSRRLFRCSGAPRGRRQLRSSSGAVHRRRGEALKLLVM